ncbi:hypothetical protein Efla_000153 [Eimeria flavescens]
MVLGKSECSPCPSGHVCTVGSIEPLVCPAGYYCSEGQGPQSCPEGTKSTLSGLTEEGQCIECGSGEACDGKRALGSCNEGFLCLAGVGSTRSPQIWQIIYAASAVQMGGPCPVGHFCTEGATTPTACQRGTSTIGEGRVAAVDCVVCSAGWYCSLNASHLIRVEVLVGETNHHSKSQCIAG